MRRTLMLCLLLLCPGCSFWAVRGPAPEAPAGGDCTTSVAAPVVDGVLAAGTAGLGIAALGDSGDFSGASHGAGAVLLAVAAVETIAAVYGGSKVGQCQRARVEVPPRTAAARWAPGLDLRAANSVDR